MAKITLTEAQLDKIRKDMDEKVEMLTDKEVNQLARKVADKTGLPFLDEERECVVFSKIIRWIDKQLYRLLPNEYYELVKDATDGISEEEAKQIRERVTPLVNDVVNIPVVPEKVEGLIIGTVIDLIINAMVKGFSLEES
jgi:DNA-binding MarR family transcriptional regulator